MKKKLFAVLLSLAMATQTVPGAVTIAAEPIAYGTEELPAEADNSASEDFSDADISAEIVTEDGTIGSTEDVFFEESSDETSESLTDSEEIEEIEETEEASEDVLGVFSDDIFQYTKISDTDAAVTGTVKNDLTDIMIPSEVYDGETSYIVTAVAEDALSEIPAETLDIPATVVDFGAQSLKSLKEITVSSENEVLFVKNGVLFSKIEDSDKNMLILYPAASDSESYVVSENTGIIGEKAFAFTQNLKILVFTDGLEKISENAVVSAENALEVVFDFDGELPEIGKNAFYFDVAEGNIFYFKNQEAYENILNAQPELADSPFFYDSEGNRAEDISDTVSFVTDGIPENIQKIVEEAKLAENPDAGEDTSSELIDESVEEKIQDKETSEKDESKGEVTEESVAEDELVGASPESLDAKISAGFYSIRSQGINKFLKIKSAGITNSLIAYLAAHNIDMGTTFSIVPLGDAQYKIIATCSNKALTLGGAAGNNVSVIQRTYSGAENQKWYIRQSSGGVYKIYPVENPAYVLDTKNQATDSATPIVLAKAGSNKTQGWNLISRTDPTANALENGIYTISTTLSNNKVLDITAGSTANGANVQIYESNGTAAQQFILRSLGYGNLYRIINSASNKALDTTGKSIANQANVQQTNQDSSAVTQIWRIVKSNDGKYVVLNAGSDRALDVANGEAKNGTNVRIYNSNLSTAQKWNFKKVAAKTAVDVNGKDAEIKAGWYTLSSARTTRTIAVKNASLANNTNVLIQAPGLGENSYFYVEPVGGGKYEIRAFCSNKVLTCIWGADSVDAGNIVQKEDSNLSTQRWYIRVSKKNNKYVSIVSTSDPNYVLSLKNNDAKWGTSVTTALSTGLNGQRWKLNPVSNPNLSAPYNGATYKIQPAKNSSYVLSTEGQSKKSGANVQLMTKVNGAGEFWVFTKVGYGNLYRITNAYTGLSIDCKNGGTTNGTNIWQYTENGSNAQLWRVMPTDSAKSKFVIINAVSGRVLDLYAGSAAAGTNIWLYDRNGTDAQEWTLSRANINTYIPVNTAVTLRTKSNKNRLVEVKDGSNADGTAVQVYSERGNTDQMFVFARKSAGVYKIRNMASNKYLDIQSTANGAEVISTAAKNSNSQLWKIEPSGDNDASFTITNVQTGYALTSSNTSNAKVVTKTYSKANTQKFYFDTPIINTGWQQVGNNWRYYDSKGNAYRDTFMENGKYYFDASGNLLTGWKKYGAYYYYFKGKAGRETADQRPYLAALFGSVGSKYNSQTRPNCPYYFTIDTARCVVTWYTRYPGTSDWNLPVCAFLCSPGKDSTPTDSGGRKTGFSTEWKSLMGPSWGQYGTEIKAWTYIAGTSIIDWTNNGEYFHSVACGSANTYNLNPNTYNLLGTKQSHGCVRLGVRSAYWIYNFVDSNTNGVCNANLAAPISTIPQAWAITSIDPTDPHYTGNWGYVDSYATAHTNGAYIPRG